MSDRHPSRATNASSRTARWGGRGLAVAATTCAGVLLTASLASAHVGVDQDEITAGASTTLTFSFGHGCDGSPTNKLAFQIPDSIVNAQPIVHPGWDVDIERQPLSAPVEAGHDEEITDRPAVITFTAQPGNEVPDELLDRFSIAFTAPDAAGQLFFKVVQGCVSGENPWIDEWDGTGDEPEHPAPSVMVVAGEPGAVADDDHHAETVVTDDADDADDADDDGDGLAIAALVVGGLALVVGGVALVRSRTSTRSTPT